MGGERTRMKEGCVRKCSTCKQTGHDSRTCKTPVMLFGVDIRNTGVGPTSKKKKALHDHNNYNGGLDLDVAHHQSHAHSLDRIKRGKGILV